jgi:predicted acetyltransferase
MGVELVPCYTDRALFLRLAKDYIETLREYDRKIVWDEMSVSEWIWHSQFIIEDRTIQGFLVTEEIDYKIYRDLLYIVEFYVVPEARMRGIGMGAVKQLMENWHGDVFFYVVHRNFGAKAFWSAVEQKLGWKRIDRPEIRQEEGCELRIFEQAVLS